jgi:hypothetical protein
MSQVLCQNGRMKIAKLTELWPVPDETIARLGNVSLVRKSNGRHDLIGGTMTGRKKARKWCACFAPFIEFNDLTTQKLWLMIILKLQLQKFESDGKCGRNETVANARFASSECCPGLA